MTIQEIKEYLKDELRDERNKANMNQPNNYTYLFMLLNDMGLLDLIDN